MNIAVIGAGASGIYYSLLRKDRHPEDSITIFEKELRPGRKILATGNGHCNLLNSSISPKYFNDAPFMTYVLNKYPYAYFESLFLKWGIPLMKKGDLVYPLSYSAKNFLNQLLRLLEDKNIKVLTGIKIESYSKRNDGYYLDGRGPFDAIVFSTGGASTPKLGSDGEIFNEIADHGYNVDPLVPGLCPIILKEKVKSISGQRHKAFVSLLINGQNVYGEEGEVLFKDDGISGIVIFNVESIYARTYTDVDDAKLKVDLFPEYSEGVLLEMIKESAEISKDYMLGFVSLELINYLLPKSGKQSPEYWAHALKNILFTIKDVYDFSSSQVTIGGISTKELDSKLMSKREKDVYFIGESVNIDGICGGFNLSWALLSALLASE